MKGNSLFMFHTQTRKQVDASYGVQHHVSLVRGVAVSSILDSPDHATIAARNIRNTCEAHRLIKISKNTLQDLFCSLLYVCQRI